MVINEFNPYLVLTYELTDWLLGSHVPNALKLHSIGTNWHYRHFRLVGGKPRPLSGKLASLTSCNFIWWFLLFTVNRPPNRNWNTHTLECTLSCTRNHVRTETAKLSNRYAELTDILRCNPAWANVSSLIPSPAMTRWCHYQSERSYRLSYAA